MQFSIRFSYDAENNLYKLINIKFYLQLLKIGHIFEVIFFRKILTITLVIVEY